MGAKKQLDEVMYKGKPVVRRGSKLYYGFIDDEYIVEIDIKEGIKENSIELATKVKIALMNNKTHLTEKERPVKKSEREGLFDALDLANAWLEDALSYE